MGRLARKSVRDQEPDLSRQPGGRYRRPLFWRIRPPASSGFRSRLRQPGAELAEQEEEVYGHGVLHPGDVVLDCGANVGVYTRVALAKGARIVVAIDLAPEPIQCLRRNFESEIREGRVIVYPKGVWDKEATLRLHASAKIASAGDSVVMDRGGLGPEVPLTTIDKLVGS